MQRDWAGSPGQVREDEECPGPEPQPGRLCRAVRPPPSRARAGDIAPRRTGSNASFSCNPWPQIPYKTRSPYFSSTCVKNREGQRPLPVSMNTLLLGRSPAVVKGSLLAAFTGQGGVEWTQWRFS